MNNINNTMNNPTKPSLETEIIPVLLVIISFTASFYFYSHFPARVPIHWDFNGKINGYGSAKFAAFFVPFLIFGLYALFLAIPFLDPKKDRYQEFQKPYHGIKNFLILFMTVIYFITSYNALGHTLPIGTIIPSMVGLLFVVIGYYMGKLKLNWMIGVRNPWTLSSEDVWNKTNKLTGKVFIIAGLLFILESFIPNYFKLSLFIFIISMIIIVPNLYSFIIFKKTQKK